MNFRIKNHQATIFLECTTKSHVITILIYFLWLMWPFAYMKEANKHYLIPHLSYRMFFSINCFSPLCLIFLWNDGTVFPFRSRTVDHHYLWFCICKFQFSSVSQSCLTLCSATPHKLQHVRLPCPSPTPGACSNHVHQVGEAIQPSHPLSSPSPPAFNLSQH